MRTPDFEPKLPVGAIVAALAAGAAAVGPALAQEPDTSAWTCERCLVPDGWSLDLSIGPAYVDEDAFRFGNYTGLDEKGTYLFGDVFAQYWGQGADYWRIEGYDLGADARQAFVRGGRQGLFELRGYYQGIPQRVYDTTQTPYLGNGGPVLTLPPGWVPATGTGGMTALAGSLHEVTVESDRDRVGAGITVEPVSRWTFKADYRREQRDGVKVTAGSHFLRAAQLLQPVDYTTDEFELGATYTGDDWQLGLAYLGSTFDNGNESLTWDNAFLPLSAGADQGRLALPPDNESHQVTLSAGMALPARTVLSGRLSLGRAEQNESFLPYTINPSIGPLPLPRESLDGEVETTNLNLKLVSSPWARWTLAGEVRYDKRDNKTPVATYTYPIVDTFVSTASVQNRPYSYESTEYRLRGEHRLAKRIRLAAGYDFETIERDLQARETTDTGTVYGQISSRAGVFSDLRIKAYLESRDGSSYDASYQTDDVQNERMRLYNLADRDRRGLEFYAGMLMDHGTTVGLTAEFSSDSYRESELGLQGNDRQRIGLDLSMPVAEKASVYASLYYESLDYELANSQAYATADWLGISRDRYRSATLGLRLPGLVGRVDSSLEYTYASSRGEVAVDVSGLEQPFPDLESRLQQLRLELSYPYSARTRLLLSYWYERFEAEDWALEGVDPDTVSSLLSLGAEPYDYHVNVIFLGLQYHFDPPTRPFRK